MELLIIRVGELTIQRCCIDSQRFESRTEFRNENHRLLPRRKVPPFIDLVVINEFGIGAFGSTPRGFILLAGEDGYS